MWQHFKWFSDGSSWLNSSFNLFPLTTFDVDVEFSGKFLKTSRFDGYIIDTLRLEPP